MGKSFIDQYFLNLEFHYRDFCRSDNPLRYHCLETIPHKCVDILRKICHYYEEQRYEVNVNVYCQYFRQDFHFTCQLHL